MGSLTVYLRKANQEYVNENKKELTESEFINQLVESVRGNKPKQAAIIPAKTKENSKAPTKDKQPVKQPKTANKVWNLKQPVKGLSMKEQINRQRSRNSA